MKKGKLLIALVAILVISAGSLVAVNYSQTAKAKAEAEAQASSTPTNTYENVVDVDKASVEEIVLIDSKGSVSFNPTEDKWAIKDVPAIELNTSAINSTCSNLLQVSASRIFDEPDLEEFGLHNATLKIQYILNEGEPIELTIGSKTPDGNNFYALKDGDTSKAYLISSYDGNEVTSSIEKFRITTLDSFDPMTISKLQASGREIEDFSIEPAANTSNMTSFALTAPTTKPLNIDAQALDNLFNSIPTFNVDQFIADEVTDFSPYGLDNPTLHLTLETTIQQQVPGEKEGDAPKIITDVVNYDYLWGNKTEDGLIYFMKANTTSVYAMDSTIVDQFLKQLTTFNLSEKLISITNIQNVESLDVSFGESTYTLSIKREEAATKSEESDENSEATDEAEVIETYFLNDLELEEDTFKDIYQNIIGTKADTDLTFKTVDCEGTPIATFRFNFTDGTSTLHQFYPYDNQFNAYKVDDELIVGCNAKQFNYIHSKLTEYTGY